MRTQRSVAIALGLSIAGSIIFIAAYLAGGPGAVLGFGAALAAAGFCAALATWGRTLIAPQVITEERDTPPAGGATIARPKLLALLGAAFGALAVAALVPLRSLGSRVAVQGTKWRAGTRVVRENGMPIRRGDLNVGSIVTAFPEGAVGDAASQVALLRLGPQEMVDARAAARAPEGYAGFSKVCTHAGCPVAIYRAAQRQLMCPCHQSLFDVLDGAKVLSGPADRALPQLPMAFDERGDLRATGDFTEPVGPGYWQRS
jgi:ubiquinol-cytochrome c reductase iron-sulfur subunit